ncbi:uncharacterized protein LOC132726953 [Ruditapes philippinarum]|uniref:uncharacterized protein LOC132726953 n=1 Tax=Ruditapes philippinarum TaxID=129788 RepID=UPI00295BBE28|nr:uncharacterized protein LOC132726953 [Ruditapes philippinarum]
MHSVSRMRFMYLLLVPCLCGALEYNEKQNGFNQNVNSRFQSFSENFNRPEQYAVPQEHSQLATYIKVPETIPGPASQPQSNYYKPNSVRPLEPISGQNTEHVPYLARQPFNQAEQMVDHHYLTRPMSVISTPHGPHYLPHRLGLLPGTTFFGHGQDYYYHHSNPALNYEKPRITVFAENIYINNGNTEKYDNKIVPNVGIQNGAKPDTLDAKMSFLKRIIATIEAEKSTLDNKLHIVDLPSLGSVKPNYMPQQSKPLNVFGTPLHLLHFIKPQNSKIPDESYHHSSEKDTENQSGQFHPLLNPSEHLQQTTNSGKPTNGKTNGDGKEEHTGEKTIVEISTDMKGVTSKHDQGEAFITVEALNNETED